MADEDIFDNVVEVYGIPISRRILGLDVGDDATTPILNDIGNALSETQDLGKGLYSFENKSDYNDNCGDDVGVEIDGFLFFPEEVSGNNTFSNREYNRTKIMSGGEFVTRGQYNAREFSFKTTLSLDPMEPHMYDKVFTIMENKPCEVMSPFMGDTFKAEIEITKTHPTASPGSLVLDINVKEIVEPKATLVGDSVIDYPSTTVLSNNAISIKKVAKQKPKNDAEAELEQITYDFKAKDNSGKVIENRYK